MIGDIGEDFDVIVNVNILKLQVKYSIDMVLQFLVVVQVKGKKVFYVVVNND